MRRYRPRGPGNIRFGRGRYKIVFLVLTVAVMAYRFIRQPESLAPQSLQPCANQTGCFTGTVTKVVDGDTLDISNVRVRLVLVDAPERDTREGPAATAYLKELCPEGSSARLQRDRLQSEDQYGRTLGVVWCGARATSSDLPVNAEMIRSRHARLYGRFCRESEFGSAPWAVELGCR